MLAAAMLVFTAQASASTVALDGDGVLRLDARGGQANQVDVREAGAPYAWTVSDTTGLTAGDGCTQLSATQAGCLTNGDRRTQVEVNVGSGDDYVVAFNNGGGPRVTLNGGAGADYLRNSTTGTAVVNGDAGSDVIAVNTNGGTAIVHGGSADDQITMGEDGSGLLAGDAGDDEISHVGPAGPEPVVLDGGPGADVLNGTDRAETILGGPGNDFIDGCLGLFPRCGAPDDLDCGPGRDQYVQYPNDVVSANCESPFTPGIPSVLGLASTGAD